MSLTHAFATFAGYDNTARREGQGLLVPPFEVWYQEYGYPARRIGTHYSIQAARVAAKTALGRSRNKPSTDVLIRDGGGEWVAKYDSNGFDGLGDLGSDDTNQWQVRFLAGGQDRAITVIAFSEQEAIRMVQTRFPGAKILWVGWVGEAQGRARFNAAGLGDLGVTLDRDRAFAAGTSAIRARAQHIIQTGGNGPRLRVADVRVLNPHAGGAHNPWVVSDSMTVWASFRTQYDATRALRSIGFHLVARGRGYTDWKL
jgi:hypothetical protein